VIFFFIFVTFLSKLDEFCFAKPYGDKAQHETFRQCHTVAVSDGSQWNVWMGAGENPEPLENFFTHFKTTLSSLEESPSKLLMLPPHPILQKSPLK